MQDQNYPHLDQEPQIIILVVDQKGTIMAAKNLDGSNLDYDSKELENERSMVGAKIVTKNNDCCWCPTPVGGRWICLPDCCF